MTTLIYDYIIIGGGIAGLYAYHRLQNTPQKLNILLLEKNDYLGGRMKEQEFHGATVKLGAGVVDETCVHILALLSELKIKLKEFLFKLVDIYLPAFNINEAVKCVHTVYNQRTSNRLDLTVDEFLHQHFDKEFIRLFYLYADYTDFHNQDINDFINNYPMDDLKREEEILRTFKYADLFNKLKEDKNILMNTEVTNIKRQLLNNQKIFLINATYLTSNIITATTINCLRKLFNYEFMNEIRSTPFCRNFIYSHDVNKIGKGTILMKNELKKIIKINKDVLMAVYCDSNHARFWYQIHEYDKKRPGLHVEVIKKLLKENDPNLDLDIKDHLHHYWDEGIHYYKPSTYDRHAWIIKNMHPEDNVYVCGEMLTIKQGWMEGAVQSVDMLFENYFKRN